MYSFFVCYRTFISLKYELVYRWIVLRESLKLLIQAIQNQGELIYCSLVCLHVHRSLLLRRKHEPCT